MLSVLIYEPDKVMRQSLQEHLMLTSGASLLKITLSTSSISMLKHMLETVEGAFIVVLGMTLCPTDNRAECVSLGNQLTRCHGDCYTVYCIHDMDDLASLLPQCARPAGILLGKYTQQQARSCFERIIEDYRIHYSGSGDLSALVVDSGSTTYRLPFDQVLYIEALNKKLNIYTKRQTITIRRSLNSIEDALPDSFTRCHRSYIVNLKHVDMTDFKDLLLTMTDGSQIPIARSMKDAFRDKLTEKGGIVG